MNSFGSIVPSPPVPSSPVVAPRNAEELMKRSQDQQQQPMMVRRASREMEEVEKAMTQLAKTIEEFHSPTSKRKVFCHSVSV